MKLFRTIALTGVLALSMTAPAFSQTGERSAEGASFNGRITSVDRTAQTVVVDGNTYQLLPTSQITSSKQAANANDLAVGDRVAGNYKRSDSDKMEVLKLDIVEKGGAQVAATSDGERGERGATFNGRVSRVDAAAQTVTIGSRTFQVLPTTTITRNGATANFNDLKSGTQLSGRYKRSDSDKMEVLSMDIGGNGANRAVGASRDQATSDVGASFNGKIQRVNRSEQTIRVEGRTYHLLPTTTITRVDGTTLNLGNLKEDQRVNGTFKRSDNGNLEVLSLQVGRQNQDKN